MNFKLMCLTASAFLLFGALPASAQNPATKMSPTPGCTTTPEQLAATKKAALDELHTPGGAKLAFVDPGYIQHSPGRLKQAKEEKISDYEVFRRILVAPPPANAAPGRAAVAGPQPPPANTTEIVTAECDIVTVVRNNFRQDPTAAPGTFYEYFTFDTYRVKNGKVTEHWDGGLITPPAPGRGQ